MRIVEIEPGPRQRLLRPGLFLQEAHGSLIAVEAYAELDLGDEPARPILGAAAGLGRLAQLRRLGGGGLELLLLHEFVHRLPGLRARRLAHSLGRCECSGKPQPAERAQIPDFIRPHILSLWMASARALRTSTRQRTVRLILR